MLSSSCIWLYRLSTSYVASFLFLTIPFLFEKLLSHASLYRLAESVCLHWAASCPLTVIIVLITSPATARTATATTGLRHRCCSIKVVHEEQHSHIQNVSVACGSILGNFDTTVHSVVSSSRHDYAETLTIDFNNLSQSGRQVRIGNIACARLTTLLCRISAVQCGSVWNSENIAQMVPLVSVWWYRYQSSDIHAVKGCRT